MTSSSKSGRSLVFPLALLALGLCACGGDEATPKAADGAGGSGGSPPAGAGATTGSGAPAGSGATTGSGDATASSGATTSSSATGGSSASSAASGATSASTGGDPPDPPPPAPEDGPVGFASLNGGTTGGEGGMVVTVSDAESLLEAMAGTDPRVIQISGTIELSGMNDVGSNKTIVGLGADAKIVGGGLYLYREKNVIIRNITFQDANEDAIGITTETTNVWIDHCTFMNGADGLVDIVRESSYVTLSWNVFRNHHKTILIGHSDAASADAGFLKVTLHHNWFDGTQTRHPSVRFGQVHVFNNHYLNNLSYGVASRMEADVVVEGNYFLNTWFPCRAGYADSEPGDIVERNNIIETNMPPPPSEDPNDPPPPATPVCETRGTAFDPAAVYSYTADPAEDVPALVMSYAGAGRI
ncbi:pectate lyase family protein [Sorangium sp. So ce233]|uniref:pectate lyase family protein n=1 Tax=Sorangium sp. So ce233 TaxID=3133290 RepID=UPI003F61F127